MAEKQALIEQKTDERFERIQTKISDLLMSLGLTPPPPSTDPPTILSDQLSTCQPPDPIPPPSASTIYDQTQSEIAPRSPNDISEEIDIARRTLGFFPISASADPTSNPHGIYQELYQYLRNNLVIPSYKIDRLEYNNVRYEKEARIVFVQFSSFQMCNLVFTHMKNLKKGDRIQKVYPPALTKLHKTLSDQANTIRHRTGCKTRIDYSGDSLVLLVKEPDTAWCPVSSSEETPSSSPTLSSSNPSSSEETPSSSPTLSSSNPSISKYLETVGILAPEIIPQYGDGNDTIDSVEYADRSTQHHSQDQPLPSNPDMMPLPDHIINFLQPSVIFHEKDHKGTPHQLHQVLAVQALHHHLPQIHDAQGHHIVQCPAVQSHLPLVSRAEDRNLHSHPASTEINKDQSECNLCNETFVNEALMLNHIQRNHGAPETSHSKSDHTADILQLDGAFDGCIDNVDEEFTFAPVPCTSNSSRQANFVMNRVSQLEGMKTDATVADFEITVNNKDQNVNIKTSTGFYDQVAKASICNLSKGSTFQYSPISVKCTDIIEGYELSGLEFNRKVDFTLSREGTIIGVVVVHMHHTKRLVQVQGSSRMPDSSRAAVWFLHNVILDRFTNLAKKKKYDITRINQLILRITNKVIVDEKSCGQCNNLFNAQSKPSQCEVCARYFHKTTCLKAHVSANHSKTKSPQQNPPKKARIENSSLEEVTNVAADTPAPIIGTPALSNPSASVFIQPYILSSKQSDQGTGGVSSLPPSSTLPPPPTNGFNFFPNLNPNAAAGGTSSLPLRPTLPPPSNGYNFLSNLNPSAPAFNSQNTSSSTRRKTKQNAADKITPEKAEINALNIELNMVRTKIVDQDGKLLDADRKIKILRERLRIFEEKDNADLEKQYFSPSNNHHPRPACEKPSSSPPPPAPCQHSPCTSCSNHQPRSSSSCCSSSSRNCHHWVATSCQHDHNSENMTDTNSISTQVADLRKEIVQLKERISNLARHETAATNNKSSETQTEATELPNELPSNPVSSAHDDQAESVDSADEYVPNNLNL